MNATDYHIAAADAARSNLERVADLMRGLAHDIEDGQDR